MYAVVNSEPCKFLLLNFLISSISHEIFAQTSVNEHPVYRPCLLSLYIDTFHDCIIVDTIVKY